MRELDTLLTNYLEQRYAPSDQRQKAAFRALLSLPDPELAGYLLGGLTPPDRDIGHVVQRILQRIEAD